MPMRQPTLRQKADHDYRTSETSPHQRHNARPTRKLKARRLKSPPGPSTLQPLGPFGVDACWSRTIRPIICALVWRRRWVRRRISPPPCERFGKSGPRRKVIEPLPKGCQGMGCNIKRILVKSCLTRFDLPRTMRDALGSPVVCTRGAVMVCRS